MFCAIKLGSPPHLLIGKRRGLISTGTLHIQKFQFFSSFSSIQISNEFDLFQACVSAMALPSS